MMFSVLFILLISLPLITTLFPYTTLFRSQRVLRLEAGGVDEGLAAQRAGVLEEVHRARRRVVEAGGRDGRSEEHTSELQSHVNLVCRLLLEKKKDVFRSGDWSKKFKIAEG